MKEIIQDSVSIYHYYINYIHRASRVEDLQHALLTVHLHLLPVAVLYGGVVLLHEDPLHELDGEGGLAHPARAKHHDLVFSHPDID